MIVLAVVLALLVGASIGIFGGGGSLLAIPIMLYVRKLPPGAAVATSALLVGVTSLAAVYRRRAQVRWELGILFGLVGMLGAYLGGLLAGSIPARALLVVLALLMFGAAFGMWRGPVQCQKGTHNLRGALALGFIVGALTGLAGAGGGFLVVPVLVLVGGIALPQASATSALVVAMQSFAALGGHLHHASPDLDAASYMIGASLLGVFVGERLGRNAPQNLLRRGFSLLLVIVALLLLAKH
jgi:hypothetical protein